LLETVLPGMIAGILGLGCIIGGIIVAYNDFGAHTGNFILIGATIALLGGFVVWMKFFPSTRLAQRFISHSEVGNIATEKPELIDQNGTALTNLRPSGTALINGR